MHDQGLQPAAEIGEELEPLGLGGLLGCPQPLRLLRQLPASPEQLGVLVVRSGVPRGASRASRPGGEPAQDRLLSRL
jgi:hypothetical protein